MFDLVAISAALFRAIQHVFPYMFPFFAPLKTQAANLADLGGSIEVVRHSEIGSALMEPSFNTNNKKQ